MAKATNADHRKKTAPARRTTASSTGASKAVVLVDGVDSRIEAVCQEIESSTKGVTRICKQPGFVSESVFYKLLNDSQKAQERYARAKSDQADRLVDEMLEIADESAGDLIVDEDGNERVNNEVVQRARLRIDTRKWIASKLKPKAYGDKVTQEHTGPGGGPVEMITRKIIDPSVDG